MRRILIDSIKGNELLAKDIISESGNIIMTTGSVVKKEYLNKLISLGINDIYIEDEFSKGIDYADNIEEVIKEQCQSIVKEIIDKYSYQGYGELEEIREVAEEIIDDILKQKEVMFCISGIRRKNESTYSHSINVCALSVLLSLRMKLSKSKVRDIAIGSLLHDIGYNSITFDYLSKEYTLYTKAEKKELMKHVIYGYTSVVKEDWLTPSAKDIILCHHERENGSGYPFHKMGDKIKIGSKIVAVCDVFDSMVYGYLSPKMKVHDAINYIISQANIKFDFKVVNYFMESVAAYPNGTAVLTNGGEVGIVLRQNMKCPTRPVLRIIQDKNGDKIKSWVERDLKTELTLFITDTVLI
jgi:HD-GYP domain-containing protein (c-di-GMP phosphodiesterase class II)